MMKKPYLSTCVDTPLSNEKVLNIYYILYIRLLKVAR